MKADRRKKLSFLFLTLAMTLSSITAFAQKASPRRLKDVRIFLVKQPYDNSDPKNPWGLQPVNRKVNAQSPLRSALIALIKGPTAGEQAKGYESSTFGIQLLSVTIKRGVAYTYFTMPEGATFSGDGSPFLFEDAVVKTTLQLPNVKKVVVCLDGILDFGSESGEPPKKCPKP